MPFTSLFLLLPTGATKKLCHPIDTRLTPTTVTIVEGRAARLARNGANCVPIAGQLDADAPKLANVLGAFVERSGYSLGELGRPSTHLAYRLRLHFPDSVTWATADRAEPISILKCVPQRLRLGSQLLHGRGKPNLSLALRP